MIKGIKKNFRSSIFIGLIGLMYIALICGCGTGASEKNSTSGTKADELYDNSIVLRSVSVANTAEIVSGHPIKVQTSFYAPDQLKNLPVDYYLVKEGSDPNTIDEQYYLGGDTIPNIESGTNVREAGLIVPSQAFEGDYKIIAYLDPYKQRLLQDDESKILTSTSIYIKEFAAKPNLVIDNIYPESDVILIGSPQAPGGDRVADYSVTAVITSFGSDTNNVPINACLQLPNGVCEPLYIWDSASQSYTETVFANALRANEPDSLKLDFIIPDGILPYIKELLNPDIPAEVSIVISVNKDKTIEEELKVNSADVMKAQSPGGSYNNNVLNKSPRSYSDNDNVLTARVILYKQLYIKKAASEPLFLGTNYTKMFADSNFGSGFEFMAGAKMDTTGMDTGITTGIPVKIFGVNYYFAQKRISLLLPSNGSNLYFLFSTKFAGFTLYEEQISLPSIDKDISVKEWMKELSASATFWVGPVPVTVSGGGRGKIGISAHVTAINDLATKAEVSLYAGPYVEIGGFGSGGVGVWGVEAGVEIYLRMLKYSIGPTLGCELIYKKDGSGSNIGYDGSMYFRIINNLYGPAGTVSLYTKAPKVKWCIAWGVPYPCGFDEPDIQRLPIYSVSSPWQALDMKLLDASATGTITY